MTGDLHDQGWTFVFYLGIIAAAFALGVMCAGPIDHLIDSCPQPSSTSTGAVIYRSEEC